ncbi:hypothetical protein ACOMHN_022019 [Nucella lapillus]
MAAITMATVASVIQSVRTIDAQPPVIKLPTPPSLEGALAPNYWLSKAAKYMEGKVPGPGSMVVVNRYVYTGLQNGWIVEIRPDGRVRNILRMSTKKCGTVSLNEKDCGRPLGIRADRFQFLIVADAYKGIFKIHPRTGAFRTLVDASMGVKGQPLGFINDLAVARDGTIFFTSSSARHNRTSYLEIMLDGDSTGRVLLFDPRAAPPNQVRELISNLRYPSGLQLSRDETYLLIGEGARAKIHRAWIGHKHPKRGVIETFVDNLPGFVANIRLSPRNTYWVALSGSRSKQDPSLLDLYGDQPDKRRELMAMNRSAVLAKMPKNSLIVELDQSGKIIRSLHDPHGQQFSTISEIEEEYGILYLASVERNFVGLLDLRRLPSPALTPSQGGGSGPGPGGSGGDPPKEDNLEPFLNQVRKNTRSLSGNELQNIVIILVRRLVEALSEIRRVLNQASELRKDLTSLQQMFPNDTETSPATQNPLSETTWFDFGQEEGNGAGVRYGAGTTQWPFGTTMGGATMQESTTAATTTTVSTTTTEASTTTADTTTTATTEERTTTTEASTEPATTNPSAD